MSRSAPAVWTALPDAAQSDRVYLDSLATLSGVRYSSRFPGGCWGLSGSLPVDPLFTHRALTPGRDVGVTVGGCDVWQGTLIAPTVADDGTRSLTADGDGVVPSRYAALGLSSHNALNIDEVIDAAAVSGRHLRLGRDATLPVPAGAVAGDGSFMMDEALNQTAAAAGQRWRVDRDRMIRFYPQDGTGEVLQLLARHDPGRTLDGQVTRLDAVFTDALTALRRAEHLDADPALTGSTVYPAFYTPDGTAYAAGGFTLYSDGTTLTAYAIRPPAGTTILRITSPSVDLTLAETSGVYARFTGSAAGFTVGLTGRAGTYRATSGGASLGAAAQENAVQPGVGSLGPTGTVPPREQVVDMTGQGDLTQAEALTQLAQTLGRSNAQGSYESPFTVVPGDLRNAGGVPVELASVLAGFQARVLVTDVSRTIAGPADTAMITAGEVEYDVDTATLTVTPAGSDALKDRPVYVDPLSGLAR